MDPFRYRASLAAGRWLRKFLDLSYSLNFEERMFVVFAIAGIWWGSWVAGSLLFMGTAAALAGVAR